MMVRANTENFGNDEHRFGTFWERVGNCANICIICSGTVALFECLTDLIAGVQPGVSGMSAAHQSSIHAGAGKFKLCSNASE
eukprot:3485058-Rhodomonas_salina.1